MIIYTLKILLNSYWYYRNSFKTGMALSMLYRAHKIVENTKKFNISKISDFKSIQLYIY